MALVLEQHTQEVASPQQAPLERVRDTSHLDLLNSFPAQRKTQPPTHSLQPSMTAGEHIPLRGRGGSEDGLWCPHEICGSNSTLLSISVPFLMITAGFTVMSV